MYFKLKMAIVIACFLLVNSGHSMEFNAKECVDASLSREKLIDIVLEEVKKAGGKVEEVRKDYVFNIREEECDYIVVGYKPGYPGGFVARIARNETLIYFTRMG